MLHGITLALRHGQRLKSMLVSFVPACQPSNPLSDGSFLGCLSIALLVTRLKTLACMRNEGEQRLVIKILFLHRISYTERQRSISWQQDLRSQMERTGTNGKKREFRLQGYLRLSMRVMRRNEEGAQVPA